MTDAALDQQLDRSLSWLKDYWSAAPPAAEDVAAARSLIEAIERLRDTLREASAANESLRSRLEMSDRQRLGCCALLQAMPDGYLVTGADGSIREANPAAADLLAALVSQGVRVAPFGQVTSDLEEIFLRLTSE